MRYFFKTILLLLVLSFVGAGTVFYTDTINLDIDSSDESEEPPQLSLEYAFQDHSSTYYLIDLWIDLEEGFEYTQNLTNAFSIKLLSHNVEIADLSSDYDSWSSTGMSDTGSVDKVTNQIVLDQNLLDLPDGTYELTVTPRTGHALSEYIEAISIPIQYTSITDYQYAINETPSPNNIGLTLYFPDESSNYLVPITRFVPQTNTTLRETVTQLESGPSANLALFDRSPIPPVPRIQLSGGTASLYLSSQLGFYNEYPNVAKMAARSLVESLGSIPEVQRIQFYFDNRIVDEGLTGVPTNTIIEPEKPPFLYVIYRAPNGRAFLVPSIIDETVVSIDEILQLLTFDYNPEFYSTEIQPTIPEEVKLISYSLAEGTLMVDFNQAFTNVFAKNLLQGRIMLDSILLTLTSVEDVNDVLIRVNGELPELDTDISFIDPLEAPAYINPEV